MLARISFLTGELFRISTGTKSSALVIEPKTPRYWVRALSRASDKSNAGIEKNNGLHKAKTTNVTNGASPGRVKLFRRVGDNRIERKGPKARKGIFQVRLDVFSIY
jgi:hypothetical protein